MNNATFTHPSYAAAMADLKARKGAAGVARWDAGEGYVAEGHWDVRVKRVVIKTQRDALRVIARFSCCEVCDRSPYCGNDCGSCKPMDTETFKVRARKGDISMIESSLGYFEVWAVDGSLGEPQRFTTWDDAVEAYEYALVGHRVLS